MKVELEVGEGTMNIITVDGVKVSLELMRHFAHPKPELIYKMARVDDVVQLDTVNLRTVDSDDLRKFLLFRDAVRT